MAEDIAGTKTSPILKRNRANRTQWQRLEQMKVGPGVFVYEGGHFVTECTPTIKLTSGKEPSLDEDGVPLIDAAGRIIYKRSGKPVKSVDGLPILGGVPKFKKIELETYKLRGVEFPKGIPVQVEDEEFALKLRCLGAVRELDEDEAAGFVPAEPKKRGRKAKPEAVDVEAASDSDGV